MGGARQLTGLWDHLQTLEKRLLRFSRSLPQMFMRFFVQCFSRAAKRGGGSKGGFPIWTCPSFLLSFLVLFGTFPIFSRIFPIGPFPLSRPVRSTYKEYSRKGLRHNQDLVGNPRFGNPLV